MRAIHKGRKTGVIVMKEFPISSDGGGDKISLTMAIYRKGDFLFIQQAAESAFKSSNLGLIFLKLYT